MMEWIVKEYTNKVNADQELKEYRDWIEANAFGLGERCFLWMWNEIVKKMAESWAKTFLATALATYLAVGLDVNAIANAALVSVLPSIINWLNPNYERYGRIK